jgi:hypothetical protein
MMKYYMLMFVCWFCQVSGLAHGTPHVCLLVLPGLWFGSWYSAYAGNKTDPNNTVILCFFVVIYFHGLAENEMFVKKS